MNIEDVLAQYFDINYTHKKEEDFNPDIKEYKLKPIARACDYCTRTPVDQHLTYAVKTKVARCNICSKKFSTNSINSEI